MAVNALPGSDEGSGEDAAIFAEINITPLTDIFLVLLIIFMVTTTVAEEEGKNIDLPEATESEETPKGVTVAVEAEGVIKINDQVVPDGMLEQMIGEAIEEAEEKIVVLKGDKRVLLGRAVNILDIAQQRGAKGIALATQQPPAGEG